ncbi:MAG: hypothetical protein LC792_19015 [Actinobacteria bacterium]|nr:hypothetical protein [Actinomycetota bacterium]
MTRQAIEKRRRVLAGQIAEIAGEGGLLPGTVLVRMMGCGKPGCRCKADPPRLHGPYIQWTRKIAGRTRTRRLTPEELERYQPWFDNARRLRELIGELETLCLQAASEAESWPEEW